MSDLWTNIWNALISRPVDQGWWAWLWPTLLQTLALMMALLLALAFILLFDRKVWAAVQLRKGPNVVGPFGLLQSFADFFKFVFKEIVIPAGADRTIFIVAPLLTFVLAFVGWAVVPVGPGLVVSDINVGILYLFAVSSLGVYGIIMGGWASNSKYPFLGGLRSAAQMVSYEVSIGFVIITVLLLVGSLNLTDIVMSQDRGLGLLNWHFIPLFPMFVVFFISALAETNRPPFDLPEAESELVAGYQVEYSSTPYLLFMIGEYLNIVLMCAMLTILFFGGWHSPIDIYPLNAPWLALFWFTLKVVVFFFMFAMVKAIVPRYRYDQLMRIGWKIFLPLSLFWVVLIAGLLVMFPGAQDWFQSWRA
ncbi:MAG: NADH-quinone oxidoreductase subunit NuoH [Parvularculaceae bacterium]